MRSRSLSAGAVRSIVVFGAVAACGSRDAAAAPVSLSNPAGGSYLQDFNSLASFTGGTLPASSNAWTNDFANPTSPTLTGWSVFSRGTTDYAAGTPSTPIFTGQQLQNYYASNGLRNTSVASQTVASLGASGSSDRAIGAVMVGTTEATTFAGSVSATPQGGIMYLLALKNDTPFPIGSLSLGYRAEQWRVASSQVEQQSLNVQFNSTASTLADFVAANSTNGWTANLIGLSASTPIINSSTGSSSRLDGNAAPPASPVPFDWTTNGGTIATGGLVTGLTRTISAGDFTSFPSTGLAPGSTFYFRFSDLNNSGEDHAFAIDDVTLSYTVIVPEPATFISAGLLTGVLFRRRKAC